MVVSRMLEFVYRALDHDGAGRSASIVDPSVGSVVGGSSSSSSSSSSSTGAGVGGEQPTMASTLQAAAGGVVSMVTTPFKSAVAARAGGRSDRETYSSSSSSSGVGGGGGGGGGSSSSLRRRKLRMLESAEPSAVREALSDLSPATTLVVTIDYADTEGGRRGGRVLPRDDLGREGVAARRVDE